jgi:hypothetical protein
MKTFEQRDNFGKVIDRFYSDYIQGPSRCRIAIFSRCLALKPLDMTS